MFEAMSLVSKGLVVSGLGLAGTFLVLVLIFCAIKLVQKANGRQSEKE